MKRPDIFQVIIILLLLINLSVIGFFLIKNSYSEIKVPVSINCKYDSDCSNGLTCSKEILCEKENPSSCVDASYCKENPVIPPSGPRCGNGGCESGETIENCPVDCENINDPNICNTLEKQIASELNKIRSCTVDSECILTKTLSLPCTFYTCDIAINKRASTYTINQLTKDYRDRKCENGCPGSQCDESQIPIAKCVNSKCTVTYTNNNPNNVNLLQGPD